jgi:hypothetical protein
MTTSHFYQVPWRTIISKVRKMVDLDRIHKCIDWNGQDSLYYLNTCIGHCKYSSCFLRMFTHNYGSPINQIPLSNMENVAHNFFCAIGCYTPKPQNLHQCDNTHSPMDLGNIAFPKSFSCKSLQGSNFCIMPTIFHCFSTWNLHSKLW